MEQTIRFYFELDNDADTDQVQSALTDGLSNLQSVEASDVQKLNQRFTGIEVAATIGAAVVIAKASKEGLDAIKDVLSSLTELIKTVKELKSVIVETGTGPKKLENVTEHDFY